MKIMINLIITFQNNENHEILKISFQNHENHEKLILPRQNHEDIEIHLIQIKKHANHKKNNYPTLESRKSLNS